MEESSSLTSLIDAEAGIPLVYEVTIVDRNGTALISSDSSLPGHTVLPRQPLTQSSERRVSFGSFAHHLPDRRKRTICRLSFVASSRTSRGKAASALRSAQIRVAVQTGLLRNEITPALRSAGLLALASVLLSVLLAAVVSSTLLRPVARISAQLDRISRGNSTSSRWSVPTSSGQVSTKIQPDWAADARSAPDLPAPCEKTLTQILSGLEDGLLLFSPDGRAVMVSPAVESIASCWACTADKLH